MKKYKFDIHYDIAVLQPEGRVRCISVPAPLFQRIKLIIIDDIILSVPGIITLSTLLGTSTAFIVTLILKQIFE